MARQLKYYKEIESHGHLWRVEILQETEDTLTPMEIGSVLQGLKLVLQGDQADIDTPIVKTSLEMTFIDAPDLDDDRKCGYWEEFYTSSATEFMVCLYKDGEKEWSGYVTPDSFSEDLRYRGSVSIIARDNLGALQDYPCDIEAYGNITGRISAADLCHYILGSSGLVALNYTLSNNAISNPLPTGAVMGRYEDSNELWQQQFDVAALSQLNMYEALERVLYSLGAVLRYTGKNTIVITTIRGMGLGTHDFWGDVPVKDVQFLAYGHRELAPAAKSIKDTIDFESVEDSKKATEVLQYGAVGSRYINKLTIDINEQGEAEPDNYGETIFKEENVPTHGYELSLLNGGEVQQSASALLDVSRYAKKVGYDSEEYGQWADNSILYYAMGSMDSCPVVSRAYCFDADHVALNFHVRIDRPVSFFEKYAVIGNTALTLPAWAGTGEPYIYYEIRLEPFDYRESTRWYDTSSNSWKTSYVRNQKPLSYYLYPDSYFISQFSRPITQIDIADVNIPLVGIVTFEIQGTSEAHCTVKMPNYGIYMRLRDFNINLKLKEEVKFTKKLTVTTKYSDKNNIVLDRSPEYGINPEYKSVAYLVSNSILTEKEPYDGGYVGQEKWAWGKKDEVNGCSLTQLIHQQILTYYAKPNSVLTGELCTEDAGFGALWEWNGKKHLLMSGSLNILTGRIERAVLREFKRYDHMWETWVENEDIDMDYPIGNLILRVHSSKALGQDALVGVPSWLGYYGHETENGVTLYYFNVMANASGQERSAIFKVDTAYVRVTQRAAGDYGIDYGKDYS